MKHAIEQIPLWALLGEGGEGVLIGHFIAFEGLDGSGKTTQAQRLAVRVRNALLTREPTDSPAGQALRSMLKEQAASDHVLARLFAADRQHHIEHAILPALLSNQTVICDRYVMSSLAYQAHSKLSVSDIWWINIQGRSIPRPALTIHLDLTPEEAVERLVQRGSARDRYETLEDLTRVSENYMRAREWLSDWPMAIVDARGTADEVELRVLEALTARLGPTALPLE